ncbi:TRAP transporter large permease subunit [Caenimonas terrae]|uniref:TRAP transporter large permease subunit n=1 Tax=Caenimonas terrae TaxID=696074 RepID=A0ABW0N5F6_9BURK
MSTGGLWMLLTLGVLVVATGLPVWALLTGVASAFAVAGVATAAFDAAILQALAPRVVNLLEHDLLQAMPLYVLIGVLLQRLPLADALYSSAARLFGRTGAGPSLAALAVGALVAPMNGSVASSSSLLSRLVAPRLRGLAPARAVVLVSAAATIGVVVPPSLVLILLGDAMLRAHTEASNTPGFSLGGQSVVSTQDVLHAALVPAAGVLLLWAVLSWRQGRQPGASAATVPVAAGRVGLAAVAVLAILGLLAGVFTGRLFAVEAAAAGGCALVVATLASRCLDRPQWRSVLLETLALSGALFALLVGATTFSLVFRLFGTDRWLADQVLQSPLPPHVTSVLVLLLVALCAWVLDAFEMIFVIIPIVAPLLIVQLHDAQQVAVLLLLVLQLSFLMPPMGYAILMTQARSGLPQVALRPLLAALAPFLGAIVLVAATVFAAPAVVHWLDPQAPAAGAPGTPGAAPSEEEIVRRMKEMATEPPAQDGPQEK